MNSSVLKPSSSSNRDFKPRAVFNRIIVGLENEDVARRAIKVTNAVAQHFEAKVYAIHALTPRATIGDYDTLPPELLEQTLTLSKARFTELITSVLGVLPPQWQVSVTSAAPDAAILESARLREADLIILGCHGRHGLDQLIFGSVSESILNRAQCPVLAIGPEFEPDGAVWKNVLFASDLGQTGISAADYAAAITTESHGKLLLLHVAGKKPNAQVEKRRWDEDNIRTHLTNFLSPAVLESCPHETLVAYGNPAEEILAAAQAKHADLIVLGIGTHKSHSDHNPWRPITHVLRHANCPVLNVSTRCS